MKDSEGDMPQTALDCGPKSQYSVILMVHDGLTRREAAIYQKYDLLLVSVVQRK